MDYPPWHLRPPLTDLSLKDTISKSETPIEVMRTEALALIVQYSNTTRIYTDASKLPEAGVAAAFYVQDLGHGKGARVDDTTSIYAAELAAIQLAVNWLLLRDTGRPATIFTDSLSAVTSLQAQSSSSCPSSMARLLVDLDRLVPPPTIAWIPGHVGVKGNEVADKIAKNRASSAEGPDGDLHIEHELRDEYALIDDYTLKRWQADYSASTTGSAYRSLEPVVSKKIKHTCANRAREALMTRLRVGRCRLNHYLHQINKHPDGLC